MKKVFLIIAILFTTHVFADISATNGVPDAATCNSGFLDTESGGVALQVQYIPETIALQWYDNNTLLNVTSTNSDSCTYGTGINLPTNPTKTGYKFTGWKVKPLYDFSTLNITNRVIVNTASGYSIDTHYDDNFYSTENGYSCMKNIGYRSRYYEYCSDNIYNDLQLDEWKVYTNIGTIYGTGKTTAKVGDNNEKTWNNAPSNWTATYDELENASGEKNYCWCQVTGYKPTNSDIIYRPLTIMPWIYESQTSNNCAMFCSASFINPYEISDFLQNNAFRNALLGK